MHFNTIIFVLFFIVFVFISRIGTKPKIILTLFNVIFLFATGVISGLYFLLTIALVYFVGIKINQNETGTRRFIYFLIGVLALVINLFLMKLVSLPLPFIAAEANLSFILKNVQLAGISFYSFTCLYYLTDIYVEKIEAESNFSEFFLFISFFPVLLSGPIIRAEEVIPQLKAIGRKRVELNVLYSAFIIFSIGLFKKVCLADNLAVLTARSSDFTGMRSLDAWFVFYGYAFQLYFDFSGYSEMAYGVAKALGVTVPVNFRYPYLSTTFSDFWKRWHISLSNFFFEYLFTPAILSIKRKVYNVTVLSQSIFPYIVSALFTMLLVGFWHGITPNYVLWGLLMGLYLILERLVFPKTGGKMSAVLQGIVVFHLVCFAWIFFRSNDFAGASHFISSLFSFGYNAGPSVLLEHERVFIFLIVVITFIIEYNMQSADSKSEPYEPMVNAMGNYTFVFAGLLWFAILNFYGAGNAFIYFKF